MVKQRVRVRDDRGDDLVPSLGSLVHVVLRFDIQALVQSVLELTTVNKG